MADEKEPEPTEEQKAKVARAIGAVAAAGVGYWLGTELADEPVELKEGQEVVYYMGDKGNPPDLWLGQVDVRPGDPIRISGPVTGVTLFNRQQAKDQGLEQATQDQFTQVMIKAGVEELPLFFSGNLTRQFKKGESATVYTAVLGLDQWGKPTERLDLGQRGGTFLLSEANLSPPAPWEAYALAAGMGLAVLRRGANRVHHRDTEFTENTQRKE